jgi:tyrosyl-tRNA synthetase
MENKAGRGFPEIELIERYIEQINSLLELKEKLSKKKPLRIKYGVDVTAPFLHLGHAVNLWMMRRLQEKGHKVVFLIGDFTTRIGDPTGKTKTRQVIPQEEIEKNAKEFIRQVSLVLLTDKEVFEVRANSEWYDRMPLSEFLSLLSMVTHARLIQRDMFQKRIEENHEIFMHELLYPILQGYDSVMLKSDLTIVGSDQLFNEQMGRFYQEKFGQEPQVIITSRITPGTDGKEKQSKSLGNYIALEDTPRDKFGKTMSLPDNLIRAYLEVYTEVPSEKINELIRAIEKSALNPMEAKKFLAEEIVSRYHGKEAAGAERAWFETAFSKRTTPEDIPTLEVRAGTPLLQVLQICQPDESKGALNRLVQGGGVRINDEKVSFEELANVQLRDGDILKIGKRHWYRISLKSA